MQFQDLIALKPFMHSKTTAKNSVLDDDLCLEIHTSPSSTLCFEAHLKWNVIFQTCVKRALVFHLPVNVNIIYTYSLLLIWGTLILGPILMNNFFSKGGKSSKFEMTMILEVFFFSQILILLIITTLIICIVGFSFQSFCLWFIPLSTTLWGGKSGHLLIYDCPASINLRDLSSPHFVQPQWDY